MSLFDILERIDHRPYWKKEKCLRYISSKSSCSKCKDVCYKDYISWENSLINIANNCDGCGACSEHCPTKALNSVEREFYIIAQTLYISFDKKFRFKANSIYFSNEYYFSMDAISRFYLQGIRKIVVIGNNRNEYVKEMVDNVNTYLNKKLMENIGCEFWSIEFWDNEKQNLPSFKDKVCSRREAFLICENEMKSFFRRVLGYQCTKDNTFLKLLKTINFFPNKNMGIYTVVLDSYKCVGCQACVKICPQNARYKKQNKVEQNFENCVGCGLCIEICPEQSLSYEEKKF